MHKILNSIKPKIYNKKEWKPNVEHLIKYKNLASHYRGLAVGREDPVVIMHKMKHSESNA